NVNKEIDERVFNQLYCYMKNVFSIELYSNLKPACFTFSLLTLEPSNNITDISPKNNCTRNAGALGKKLVFPNDRSRALEKSFIIVCSEETALKTPFISFVFKINSYKRT